MALECFKCGSFKRLLLQAVERDRLADGARPGIAVNDRALHV